MTQRHRRLLILENDPQLRAELESNFRDLDVSSAGSGDHAQVMALLRRLEPDVVLFDLGEGRDAAEARASLELIRHMLALAPDT